MSTHGDFIDYLVFRESSIPTRKKVTLPPRPRWPGKKWPLVLFGKATPG